MTEPLAHDDLPVAFRKGNSTEGLLPIAGYLIGDQVGSRLLDDLWGDRIAIVLMTVAAGWAVVQRLRRGERVGWWIPSIAIYLFLRGLAGLIWGEDVFLGIGIALKVCFGLAALGSVLIGKPLAAKLAPLVLPFSEQTQRHTRFIATMRDLTLAYALYQLITVAFETWLLQETSSGSAFFIIRFVIGWVAGFIGFMLAIFYADWRLKRIPGFPGVLTQFEQIGMILEQQRAQRDADG